MGDVTDPLQLAALSMLNLIIGSYFITASVMVMGGAMTLGYLP